MLLLKLIQSLITALHSRKALEQRLRALTGLPGVRLP